jgi:DNA primase
MPYTQEEKIRGSLQCSGLIKPSGHEFFRGAIIFPFVDENNNVTGGYGRRITTKLRAGSVYHLHWLSEETTFFNLPILQQHKTIILCKNPVDALSAYCLGYYNVISLMGAQSFDYTHIEKLKQHNVSTILLACGGNIYNRRIKTKLRRAGFVVHILKLPQGLDMNQCLLSSTVPKSFLSSLINHTLLH